MTDTGDLVSVGVTIRLSLPFILKTVVVPFWNALNSIAPGAELLWIVTSNCPAAPFGNSWLCSCPFTVYLIWTSFGDWLMTERVA